MNIASAVAIFFLFWVLSALIVLPFINASEKRDADSPLVPGQADSAPGRFPVGRILLRATILAVVLYAIFALNYEFGWVTANMLDYYH
ncbi:hypothetical protein GCM10023219_25270 [Stakelama sediminis]|uniref:Putative secreted protein n=1 Tax=Stakelama sediminis TaxID=463200 RepID=A0A840YZ61_9SPHN|nr:DUF1467 family protein [Stakelama sediminis]MBB5718794.1 putative secreted protein [Stakelama sediminis]